MSHEGAPLACDLNALSAEERARRATLAGRLRGNTREVIATESGYEIRLVDQPTAYHDALELALLERRCCAFLEFELKLESENGPVWLVLGGGPHVKQFLSATDLVSDGSD